MSSTLIAPTTAADTVLIYELDNSRPVELLDFTSSLLAVGESYQAFLRKQNSASVDDDYRLYVKEVRSGSIVAELISIATQGQILAPVAPFLMLFAGQLGEWFEFFKGVKDAKDIKELLLGTTKKELKQLSEIIEPVAKDGGSQLNIVVRDQGNVTFNLTLNHLEANAIQNRIQRHISMLPDSISGTHLDQVLYWFQVRAESTQNAGDRAIVERFSKRPVKVAFASEAVKQAMLEQVDNPFLKLYVVDVDVTEVGGKPVLYKILVVKDQFMRDE